MFQAPKSIVDVSFWERLYALKLNTHRLSTPAIAIQGYIKVAEGTGNRGGGIEVDGDSFADTEGNGYESKR